MISFTKLLILSSEFPPGPGGIGIHAWQLASQFQQRGMQVAVFAAQDHAVTEEIRQFNRQQSFVIMSFGGSPLHRVWNCWKAVEVWQPDFLLASGLRLAELAAVLTFVNKIPWFAVGHGSEFLIPQGLEKKLAVWAYRRAKGVVCVSSYTSQLLRNFGVNPQKFATIPNGADENLFMPLPLEQVNHFRKEYGLYGRLLLSVGNVTERKGHDLVIRAMPSIIKAVPTARYVVIGLPTLRSEYLALAQSLGVGDRVHFLGRVDNATLVKAYNACEIFIMPSRRAVNGDVEGFGIAAVEAALCGRPAVVTTGSGLQEAVIDGQTGLCVPPNAPEELARVLIGLLENDTLRMKLGNQARLRAQEGFTWTKVADRYLDFFRLTLRGQNSELP